MNKFFIILFIGWISFFPEPVQGQYQIFVELFLSIVFLFFLLRQRIILFDRRDLPLIIFLASILCSLFSAKDKLVAVEVYSHIAIPLFLIYFLAKAIFSSENNFLTLAKVTCLFSSIVALLGIVDLLIGKNIIYEYLIYNPYYARYIINASLRRPLSFQFNPVPLGTYLLSCLPMGFILMKEKSVTFCILGLVSVVLNTLVAILTLSRGAFIGLFMLLLFYLWHKKKKLLLILTLIAIFMITVLCVNLIPYKGYDVFSVEGILYSKNYKGILSQYRIGRIKMTLNILKAHPLFGIGLSHFRIRFFEYYPKKSNIPYEWRIADNMYLTILAETGLLGFFSFLLFIFCIFKDGLISLNGIKNEIKKQILLIGLSALLGILVTMVSYELFYWHTPFFLLCFLCGLVSSQFQ